MTEYKMKGAVSHQLMNRFFPTRTLGDTASDHQVLKAALQRAFDEGYREAIRRMQKGTKP